MSNSEARISDPELALRVVTVLASRAKLRILCYLSTHPGATAKEVAEYTGTSLPTVLEHLAELSSLGLVRVVEERKGARRVKRYYLAAKRISIIVDFDRVRERGEERLRRLLDEYLNLRSKGVVVKASPHAKELKKLLGLSEEEARELAAFIRDRLGEVVSRLAKEAREKVKGSTTVRSLSTLLRVDMALAAMVATRMIEEGWARAERGRIIVS